MKNDEKLEILDVKVKLADGTLIDIEMQNNKNETLEDEVNPISFTSRTRNTFYRVAKVFK